MSMETFKAGVQYDDLTGSSAADRADKGDATEWLRKNGHLQQGEVLVGISAYVSSSILTQGAPLSVGATFLVSEHDALDSAAATIRQTDPVILRKISVDLDVSDFFRLFKRFEITLSPKGLLEGREYRAE